MNREQLEKKQDELWNSFTNCFTGCGYCVLYFCICILVGFPICIFIFSCAMLSSSNHGMFDDYYYNDVDMFDIVNGFCVAGLVMSLTSLTRIAIAPIINKMEFNQYNNIYTCTTYRLLYVLEFLFIICEYVYILGIIVFPAMGNKLKVFESNQPTYNGTEFNNTQQVASYINAYVISMTFLCITGCINLFIGLPIKNYYSIFGFIIFSKTPTGYQKYCTWGKMRCCSNDINKIEPNNCTCCDHRDGESDYHNCTEYCLKLRDNNPC